MNMAQIAVDVHGCPGQVAKTRAKSMLQVFLMRRKQHLDIWPDLAVNPVVLGDDVLKFVLIHLELFFLKKDDFGGVGDVSAES